MVAAAYGDPVLDQLVADALQENLSLRSAGLRVLQSQQQLAIAVGNQYPSNSRLRAGLQTKGDGDTFKDYNVGFNLAGRWISGAASDAR